MPAVLLRVDRLRSGSISDLGFLEVILLWAFTTQSADNKNSMRSLMAGITLLIAAFATPAWAEGWERGAQHGPLIKQGAQRLSAAEVRSMIVGKTESWGSDNSGRQAGYYAPDGMLSYKYQGKNVTERYTVSGNGTVCFKSGGCHYHLRYNGKVVVVWNGKTRGAKR